MGLIERMWTMVFGGNRNVLVETAGIFRENAEAGAKRDAAAMAQAQAQYRAEFAGPQRAGFDRFMDGVNRLPRPALAFGTLALFVAAMTSPAWFAARMQGIALVPEPLWWLLGVIVSFYFGARHQLKSHELRRDLAGVIGRTAQVVDNIEALGALQAGHPGVAATGNIAALELAATAPSRNPALDEWHRRKAG